MVQTKAGASKYVATMIKKFGSREAWLANLKLMGAKGGRNSSNGGFASDVRGLDGLTGQERASVAGRKGGTISRRGKRNEIK